MIRGEMMVRMSSWEYAMWQAYSMLEHEEYMERRAQAEADALLRR